MLPEKTNIICLLQILTDHSDMNHPMPMFKDQCQK